jgi:predicted lipoprotein with Yx(FWY)xxD motif
MHLRRKSILAFASVFLLAVALAACGGSDNSSDTTSATASPAAGGDTVSTKSISGSGTVLVDSKGAALYTNNRDSGMNVACTGSCTAIWVPLMAPSSGQPTSSDQAVQAKLGVVMANGGSQVTWGGKPLYTFVQDSPGQVTGNGVTDQFSGTSFTWTAATAGGAPPASSGNTTTAGSTGGGGGGY